VKAYENLVAKLALSSAEIVEKERLLKLLVSRLPVSEQEFSKA